jgi:hypothetical protein
MTKAGCAVLQTCLATTAVAVRRGELAQMRKAIAHLIRPYPKRQAALPCG